MYQASSAYIEQMMHHGTRRRLTGTVGNIPFDGEDIVRGSFSVSNRATEESDTKIGGVFLGELEMTFIPSFLSKVARDEFKDKEVAVSIGLWIPDEEDEIDGGDWEDIPVGVYTLQAPKISKQGISVTGYDNMKKLDKPFNIDQTMATPFGYLTYIAEECGVELGNTQAEIEAMNSNGGDILPLESPNDIQTFRDLLYWVAQALGGFATANRNGAIEVRRFGNPTDIEIDEMHRDTDVIFSGYQTSWTGIYITDTASQQAMYYGLEHDTGLTMNLGANPLLQIGSAGAIDRRRRAVLASISEITYTPFYMNSARDPIFDLGDSVWFVGGISGNSKGCVMAYEYRLDNFNLEGFGDDPALTNAQSKQDKNISALNKSTVKNETTFYNFANAQEISIQPEEETTLASLAFTAADKTTVKILHEFIFDMLADFATEGSYEIRYYLDEELVAYKPYERLAGIDQLTEGDTTETSITRDFYYIIKDVEPNERHTWQVCIITHGIEETTIETNHAHVTIEGQRLYGDRYFDGFIEARDSLTIIPLGFLQLISITDEATVTVSPVAQETITDEMTLEQIGGISADFSNISEGVTIYMENLRLASEDDEIFRTEDGIRLVLE